MLYQWGSLERKQLATWGFGCCRWTLCQSASSSPPSASPQSLAPSCRPGCRCRPTRRTPEAPPAALSPSPESRLKNPPQKTWRVTQQNKTNPGWMKPTHPAASGPEPAAPCLCARRPRLTCCSQIRILCPFVTRQTLISVRLLYLV